MESKLSDFIVKSLEYYDNQKTKNINYFEQEYFNLDINDISNEISFISKNKISKLSNRYQVLGVFNIETRIWLWSWVAHDLNISQTELATNLLLYGLKIDSSIDTDLFIYLKTQLVNSKLLIENDIALDIHLSMISYLLKEKILFIFFNMNKDKITYYLIL